MTMQRCNLLSTLTELESKMFNSGNHKGMKNATIYTPDALSAFLYDIVSPSVSGGMILDPCVGAGSLLNPWRTHGYDTIAIDIEDQGFPGTIEKNYLDLKADDFKNKPSLVVINPPFNVDIKNADYVKANKLGNPLIPQKFFEKTIEMFGRDVPIVMITAIGFRMSSKKRLEKFIAGEYPEPCSFVTLSLNAFDNIAVFSECLIFNVPNIKPCYTFYEKEPKPIINDNINQGNIITMSNEPKVNPIYGQFREAEAFMWQVIYGQLTCCAFGGGPGLGKTRLAVKLVKESKKPWALINKATMSGIILKLYELREGGIIILDDIDSLFKGENNINVMKMILNKPQEGEKDRVITNSSVMAALNAESGSPKASLTPPAFNTKAKIIWITNKSAEDFEGVHFAALKSRGMEITSLTSDPQALGDYTLDVAVNGLLLNYQDNGKHLSLDKKNELLQYFADNGPRLEELRARQKISALVLLF